MNKQKFVEQLRATADVLKPLIGSMFEILYLDKDDPGKINKLVPEPYALSWWMTLRNIASLIEAQEGPLSERQIIYLKRELFGGMGSLHDVSFLPREIGELANEINKNLRKEIEKLFLIFKDLKTELGKD